MNQLVELHLPAPATAYSLALSPVGLINKRTIHFKPIACNCSNIKYFKIGPTIAIAKQVLLFQFFRGKS
jgi:hypothetical protein